MSAPTPKLPAPTPMAGQGQPVDWLFIYKFNTGTFPGCPGGKTPPTGAACLFGGTVQDYKEDGHSQCYVYATSADPTLRTGAGCLGATATDPLGATFGQIYNTPGYSYVVWNDQFYGNPIPNRDSPWGHSKGLVAWNAAGEGLVLQVSTPSWPGSASKAYPRQNDGNTLGCIKDDDIEVAQHFFALKLTKPDVAAVLNALIHAGVATDITQPSIVQNGGPTDLQALVKLLGKESTGKTCLVQKLSSGVQLLAKPAPLAVPPWQMVSALLGGVSLRVASWWADPEIYSTVKGQTPACWAPGLGTPGSVQIATTGTWDGKSLGLTGGEGPNFNHAKVAVSTDGREPLCFFGDMNQQGALAPGYAYPKQVCSSSQNGRGGTFFVLNNAKLHASLTALLQGDSAPTQPPSKKR